MLRSIFFFLSFFLVVFCFAIAYFVYYFNFDAKLEQVKSLVEKEYKLQLETENSAKLRLFPYPSIVLYDVNLHKDDKKVSYHVNSKLLKLEIPITSLLFGVETINIVHFQNATFDIKFKDNNNSASNSSNNKSVDKSSPVDNIDLVALLQNFLEFKSSSKQIAKIILSNSKIKISNDRLNLLQVIENISLDIDLSEFKTGKINAKGFIENYLLENKLDFHFSIQKNLENIYLGNLVWGNKNKPGAMMDFNFNISNQKLEGDVNVKIDDSYRFVYENFLHYKFVDNFLKKEADELKLTSKIIVEKNKIYVNDIIFKSNFVKGKGSVLLDFLRKDLKSEINFDNINLDVMFSKARSAKFLNQNDNDYIISFPKGWVSDITFNAKLLQLQMFKFQDLKFRANISHGYQGEIQTVSAKFLDNEIKGSGVIKYIEELPYALLNLKLEADNFEELMKIIGVKMKDRILLRLKTLKETIGKNTNNIISKNSKMKNNYTVILDSIISPLFIRVNNLYLKQQQQQMALKGLWGRKEAYKNYLFTIEQDDVGQLIENQSNKQLDAKLLLKIDGEKEEERERKSIKLDLTLKNVDLDNFIITNKNFALQDFFSKSIAYFARKNGSILQDKLVFLNDIEDEIDIKLFLDNVIFNGSIFQKSTINAYIKKGEGKLYLNANNKESNFILNIHVKDFITKQPKINFTLNGSKVNLNEFFPWIPKQFDWSDDLVNIPLFDNFLVNMQVDIDQFIYQEIELNDMFFTAIIMTNSLQLQEFRAKGANKKGNILLDITGSIDTNISLEVNYNINSVPITNFMLFFFGVSEFGGEVNMKGTIFIKGRTPQKIIKNLNSQSIVRFKKPYIKKINPLGITTAMIEMAQNPNGALQDFNKVFLSHYTIFNEAKGELIIKKGVVFLKLFRFEGNGVNAFFVGKFNMSKFLFVGQLRVHYIGIINKLSKIRQIPLVTDIVLSGKIDNLKVDVINQQILIFIENLRNAYRKNLENKKQMLNKLRELINKKETSQPNLGVGNKKEASQQILAIDNKGE